MSGTTLEEELEVLHVNTCHLSISHPSHTQPTEAPLFTCSWFGFWHSNYNDLLLKQNIYYPFKMTSAVSDGWMTQYTSLPEYDASSSQVRLTGL